MQIQEWAEEEVGVTADSSHALQREEKQTHRDLNQVYRASLPAHFSTVNSAPDTTVPLTHIAAPRDSQDTQRGNSLFMFQ